MAVDVMGEKIRLDKYLVEMGMGTRSQVKEAARKGRIRIDGIVETDTSRKVDPDKEQVSFDGEDVSYVRMEYYVLNKPQGVVSATEDRHYKTVVELIDQKQRKDLFPVGRLDVDTEGLLLITNDGELAHRLLSPKHHVDKKYYAIVEGMLPGDAAVQFEKGIVLKDGTVTMPAHLKVLKSSGEEGFKEGDVWEVSAKRGREGEEGFGKGNARVLVTVQEGKFHQVKRMFEALGCKVVFLKRMSMGPLVLDEGQKPGEYRALTEEELCLLQTFKGVAVDGGRSKDSTRLASVPKPTTKTKR